MLFQLTFLFPVLPSPCVQYTGNCPFGSEAQPFDSAAALSPEGFTLTYPMALADTMPRGTYFAMLWVTCTDGSVCAYETTEKLNYVQVRVGQLMASDASLSGQELLVVTELQEGRPESDSPAHVLPRHAIRIRTTMLHHTCQHTDVQFCRIAAQLHACICSVHSTSNHHTCVHVCVVIRIPYTCT